MTVAYKACKKCGCLYEDGDIENAFRLARVARYTSQRFLRPICIVCEQQERDSKKAARRHRRKAQSCLANHYRKYKRAGFQGTKQDFAERYRYNLDVMEIDLKQVEAEHICSDCGHPFRVLDDITLDIREPDESPIYGSYKQLGCDPKKANTEWICRTCNNSKGTMDMVQWEAKKHIFRIQKMFQERLKEDCWAGLPLFETIESKGKT